MADVVRAAVLGTPLSRLELTEGAPLRLTDAMAVGRPVGRVARAAYTDGNKPSAILLVLRDAQTDALSFVRLGGAGALNGWSNQPALPLATLERLQLPEEEPGALFADFQKESVGAASLVALRGRAQRTLALLCTRRAVMRLVSACGASSAGGVGSALGASLEPAELLGLLKLAHAAAAAASSAAFDDLFDGLRALLRAPPPQLAALPAALCADALADVRRTADAVASQQSKHPLQWKAARTPPADLRVGGAAALRVELDDRSLPWVRAGGRLQLLAPRDGAGGAQSVRGTLDEKNSRSRSMARL